MSDLYWLSEAQMERLRPYFPKSHGVPRVDDRRVLSGIILINRNGLRWRDAPEEYGPHKTFYNRWKRWSDMGVFARIMAGLAAEASDNKTISIPLVVCFTDHCRQWTRRISRRTARPQAFGRKRGAWTPDRPHEGVRGVKKLSGDSFARGRNTKLHAVTDAGGRPIRFFVTAGQVSD
ncbi:hypothetical protein PARPLA_02353 [Rhodobacteraceae bacterium THAF1]|uniref:IS5 family transposase n=1 Tax=Palleronia sp. THAF1 TaxID=2587842 RepID=UPI000F3CF131|nr:hypothetical protein FIU81_10820 [Palleronia sp. THAF1]VDC27236.1 hypothetical protein PARPLA_02353 [Rhodobacteraceae bacterium THAF1]